MDKRWIIIFIILIAGVSTLYLIANESIEIGKAITTIDNVIITLPDNFKITDQDKTSVEMTNRNSNEKLSIELIKEKNKAEELMENKLQELRSENVINIEDSTKNISNITVYSINYQDMNSDTPVNCTVNYINKLNKTFVITTSHYEDNNAQLNDLTQIIETLRLDFKVKDK